MMKNYNEVIDTYGDKVLKTGIGHHMNARYEIWEDGALRMHSVDKELIMRDWQRIRTTEPMFRIKEKMPYIRW